MENPVSVEHFHLWLRFAKPNDSIVYYRGETLTFSLMTVQIKRETWDKALEGLVYLVQRKLGVGNYEYIAIRASSSPVVKFIPVADGGSKIERHSPRLQNYSSRRLSLMERVMS